MLSDTPPLPSAASFLWFAVATTPSSSSSLPPPCSRCAAVPLCMRPSVRSEAAGPVSVDIWRSANCKNELRVFLLSARGCSSSSQRQEEESVSVNVFKIRAWMKLNISDLIKASCWFLYSGGIVYTLSRETQLYCKLKYLSCARCFQVVIKWYICMCILLWREGVTSKHPFVSCQNWFDLTNVSAAAKTRNLCRGGGKMDDFIIIVLILIIILIIIVVVFEGWLFFPQWKIINKTLIIIRYCVFKVTHYITHVIFAAVLRHSSTPAPPVSWFSLINMIYLKSSYILLNLLLYRYVTRKPYYC